VLGVSSRFMCFRSWGKRPPVAGTAAEIARDAALIRTGSACRLEPETKRTTAARLVLSSNWADLEAEQFQQC